MKYVLLLFIFYTGLASPVCAQDKSDQVKTPNMHISSMGANHKLKVEYVNGKVLDNIRFTRLGYNNSNQWGLKIGTYMDAGAAKPPKYRLTEGEFLNLLGGLLDYVNSKDIALVSISVNIRLVEPLWIEILPYVREAATQETGTIRIKEGELRSAFDEALLLSNIIKAACDTIARKGYKCVRQISAAHVFRHEYRGKPWAAILKDDDLGIHFNSAFNFRVARQ